MIPCTHTSTRGNSLPGEPFPAALERNSLRCNRGREIQLDIHGDRNPSGSTPVVTIHHVPTPTQFTGLQVINNHSSHCSATPSVWQRYQLVIPYSTFISAILSR